MPKQFPLFKTTSRYLPGIAKTSFTKGRFLFKFSKKKLQLLLLANCHPEVNPGHDCQLPTANCQLQYHD